MIHTHIPPAGFYFAVFLQDDLSDASGWFQEVSGLAIELETTENHEADDNRFIFKTPVHFGHAPLIFKRGLLPVDSDLMLWVQACLSAQLNEPLLSKTLVVALINGQNSFLQKWAFYNTLPLKIELMSSNSTANEWIVESIELSYSYFSAMA